MSKENVSMCPLFPDMPCPQGKDKSESCKVRMNAGYDPMTSYKDYVFMNCAVRRAGEERAKLKKSGDSKRNA